MRKFMLYLATLSLLLLNVSILVARELDNVSLNDYLRQHGFYLYPINSPVNEGYMSDSQKEQFNQRLSTYKNIHKVLEIGLNGGHSAENFFNNLEDLELFASFDINHHAYTGCAVNYFYTKFQNRFMFTPGDSMKTVPKFIKNYPFFRFDLIFIDGCHAYDWVISDIIHCKEMAHADTILWVDDVPSDLSGPIGEAVKKCQDDGIIEIIQIHQSNHPIQYARSWLEAKFIWQ